MFSLNGHPLTNPALDWETSAKSQPRSPLTYERTSLVIPGRDGVEPGLEYRVEPPSIVLETITTEAGLDPLQALYGSDPLLLTWQGRGAEVEVMSTTPVTDSPAEESDIVRFSAVLRITGVYWRDLEETTTEPLALDAASVAVPAFPGITGPVRDATIRVGGQVSNLKLTGLDGSWISYQAELPAGSWLRIDQRAGRAWLTPTDTWAGGAEVSGLLGFGRGPYPLTIAPAFTDPADRTGLLTVTSSARAGASIEVRGRGAYRV